MTEKRMLTASNSALGNIDLASLLRKEEAWLTLPLETRRHLYSLLPPDSLSPDPDVNPLKTTYKASIEAELRRWQEDLKAGREGKKWRAEAMQAGKDRMEGKFDAGKEALKEEVWGNRGNDNIALKKAGEAESDMKM